ncbi:MAG: hypothetical protein KDA80_24875, partial [Planctomycetaceae bacterium]|nr:hypothetical protein [Planctomycetaceae bacterium]
MDSPVEHEPTPSPTWRGQCLETVLTAGVAVAFCWFFWRVLWSGGGVIGGDLYPYYMPQKFWLQQCFAQGEWPLWNPLVGFGYPILGESQTGAFYPPNLLLYRWLDLNTAYVWSQLGHYILAFMLFTALSRRLGLSLFASWLSATVFVYGWFPPRICLEWAIIGGTWLAGSLWSATAFLQSHRPRWALMVSLCTAMSLLAGHYNLEFITLLMLAAWPLVVRQENVAVWRNGRVWGGLGVALACGFCMGAVQLLPTWELKQLSQRQGDGPEFSATYGHLPPEAISQLWMPWRWYAGNEPMDRSLEQSQWLAVPDATNQAEAQIYVGAIPFLLAVLALWWKRREGESLTASWRWALLAMVGLLLATGWPTYVLRDVPGFSFFRGPGRYSSITVVVLAIWAGQGLDAVRRKWRIQSIKSRLVGLTVVAVSL